MYVHKGFLKFYKVTDISTSWPPFCPQGIPFGNYASEHLGIIMQK